MRVAGKQFKAAGPLKDIDAPVDIIRQLFPPHFGSRQRGDIRIGIGHADIVFQVLIGDALLLRQRAVLAHQQGIAEFRHQLTPQTLFFHQFLIVAVVVFGIPQDAQLIVILKNILQGTHSVGFLVEDFKLLIGGKLAGKTGKGLRDIAGARHRDGKVLFLGGAFGKHMLHLIHLLQDRLGIPQEHPALRGQLHPVGAALKDSNTQAVFQLLDGPAEIGLAHKQAVRRFIDGAGLRHSHGIFHVLKIHRIPPALFRHCTALWLTGKTFSAVIPAVGGSSR